MARAHVGGQFYGVPNILLEQLFNVRTPRYSVSLLFYKQSKNMYLPFSIFISHYVILLSVKAICLHAYATDMKGD